MAYKLALSSLFLHDYRRILNDHRVINPLTTTTYDDDDEQGVHNDCFVHPQSVREVVRPRLERCCGEKFWGLRDPRDQDVHVLYCCPGGLCAAVEVGRDVRIPEGFVLLHR